MNISFNETEKWLKRALKNRVKVEQKTIIVYLMMGIIGLGLSTRVEATIEATREDFVTSTGSKPGTKEIYINMDDNTNALAIGGGTVDNAKADVGGVAIGAGTVAKEGSTSIGYKANSGNNAVAIGYGSEATGSSAIGFGLNVKSKAFETIAIGRAANASGQQSLAFGSNSSSIGAYSIAAGIQSKAQKESAIAIGNIADSNAEHGIAVGSSSRVTGDSGIAIGRTAFATGERGVAIGRSSTAAGKYSMAYGVLAKSTNAAENGIAMGNRAEAAAANAISIGTLTVAKNDSAIAIGNGATATGENSISIGTGNIVRGANSGALGDPSIVEGTGSYTVGNDNVVGSISKNVSVLGNNNQIGATATYNKDGKLQTASGLTNKVAVENSKAIGNNNYINTSNTYVLGSGIGAKDLGTVENSVYLGNDSTAVKGDSAAANKSLKNKTLEGVDGTTTTAGATGTLKKATVNKITYGDFAGATAIGAVTVGSAGAERRIMNVAAGEISATSTDAINGSQLYMVTNHITENSPFEYVDKDGKPVVKIGDKFYPAGTVIDGTGKPITVNEDGTTTPANKVVDQNNVVIKAKGDNPENITNVAGNLTPTYNGGDSKVDPNTGKLNDGEKVNTATKEQAAPANVSNIYNNAATVGDVLNAGWNLQGNGTAKDFVKPYDIVNFADGKGTTVDVTTDAAGKTSTIKVNVDKGVLTGDKDISGKIVGIPETEKKAIVDAIEKAETKVKEAEKALASATPDTQVQKQKELEAAQKELEKANADKNNALNKVATVENVAEAINNSGWKVVAGTEGTGELVDKAKAKPELINPGETVTLKAGDNLKIDQDGSNFTYSLSSKLEELESAEFVNGKNSTKIDGNGLLATNGDSTTTVGPTIITVGDKAGTDDKPVTIKSGDNGGTISNLDGNLDGAKSGTTSPKEKGTIPTNLDTIKNNAATVGDVLNVGWNLQGNGTAVDFVKPYDTVNFINGKGTTVEVKTDDNLTSTIKVDVNAQDVINESKQAVVYTKADGTQVYPIIDKDGNVKYNTQADGKGEEVDKKDVITSVNGPDGTKTPTTLANVAGNLPDTYSSIKDKDGKDIKPTTEQATPDKFNPEHKDFNKTALNNAATVGDVLNVGWNLQGNGKAVDFVKPYDTVNFANGTGTTVDVSTDENGKVSTIKVNTVMQYTDKNGNPVTKNEAGDYVTADGNKVNAADIQISTVNPDGKSTTPTKIGNVAAGTESNDAVNVSQLKDALENNVKVTGDKNITVTSETKDGVTTHNVKLNDTVTLGNDPTKQVKVDGTTGTISIGDNTTISNGNAKFDKVEINGTDGTITGLTNQKWEVGETQPVDGRAATENQLKHVEDGLTNKITDIKNNTVNELTEKGLNFAANSGEVHKNLGEKLTIKGSGTKADEQYSSENIKTKIDKDGNLEIMLDKDLKANNITVGEKGVDGKDGVDGTIGVNGKDGSSVVINGKDGSIGAKGADGASVTINGKDGTIGLTGPKGTDGKDGANATLSVKDGSKGFDGNNGKDGESKTRIAYETKNPDGTTNTEEVATLNDGLLFTGNNEKVNTHKLNSKVTIKGEGVDKATSEKFVSAAGNINVKADGGDTLEVQLAKDIKGLSTIETKDAAGNTTVTNGEGLTITPKDGEKVSITKDGLNNGGNKITNVAAGTDGTDGVNVSQLRGMEQNINNRIDDLDHSTRRGIAGAMAQAGVKFQEQGVNQVVVGAAASFYRGQGAVAVGVQGAPTENTRVHTTVSATPGRNTNAAITVGGSWKFNIK
ncbi:YadA-like family protein [Fusobacterium gastrosuis]|uniref:YadA-like family protein n=2 Tax=Fusobacterium gastrosuis TaxID=1755100 RepID=UPI00297A99F4|nr:YadA-like family protein [Fusobacteriaceae bacterium]MDY5713174.1 YadA-like family protein [Fusobacterium gastrosuis]